MVKLFGQKNENSVVLCHDHVLFFCFKQSFGCIQSKNEVTLLKVKYFINIGHGRGEKVSAV